MRDSLKNTWDQLILSSYALAETKGVFDYHFTVVASQGVQEWVIPVILVQTTIKTESFCKKGKKQPVSFGKTV